jgi:hypothetical protein
VEYLVTFACSILAVSRRLHDEISLSLCERWHFDVLPFYSKVLIMALLCFQGFASASVATHGPGRNGSPWTRR